MDAAMLSMLVGPAEEFGLWFHNQILVALCVEERYTKN